MRRVAAGAVVLLAASAWGQCSRVAHPMCLCGEIAAWVAEVQVTTDTIGTVTEVFPGGAGVVRDAGAPPAVGSMVSFQAGVVLPGGLLLLDSSGGAIAIHDGGISCEGFPIPVEQWATSVGNDTCTAVLIDAGFKPPAPPPCRDTGGSSGCGCGAAGAPAWLAFVALLRALRRRR